jgi:hypothetical protein
MAHVILNAAGLPRQSGFRSRQGSNLMNVPDLASSSSRRTYKALLIVFCGLTLLWSVLLVFSWGSSVSNVASLAVAIGSSLLILAHLDRNAHRKRVWMLTAFPLIAVSLILAAIALVQI